MCKWKSAIEFLSLHCPDIKIYGLSSENLGEFSTADVTYELDELSTLCKNHVIDGVINIEGANHVNFRMLEDHGISDIFFVSHIYTQKLESGEDVTNTPVLLRYKSGLPELSYLEVHLADHCNLNCKGCAHFSNLVPEAVFADKEQFRRDIQQLTKRFSCIHTFFLLGGEPLLNKDIAEFIPMVHDSFPYTQICIVTNGILIPQMTDEVIQVIRQHHVLLSVSAYPVLDCDKITDFATAHDVEIDLRPGKQRFAKYLNCKGDSDKNESFLYCVRKDCTFMQNGRIACCCQPFTIHYFNEYFHENILENETIDLYDDSIDGWQIARQLSVPMETCRYCTFDHAFDWQVSKAPFSKDDWCVE
jgi:hypothetical protein